MATATLTVFFAVALGVPAIGVISSSLLANFGANFSVMAWLLTFAKTLLELPLSQLLYAPNLPPISVSVNKLTAYYDFGEGTAMSVIALALAFGVFLLAGSSGFYLRQVGKMLAKV